MPITSDDEYGIKGECDHCGERFNSESQVPSINEFAEFWDPSRGEGNESLMLHGQCGIDLGLEMA